MIYIGINLYQLQGATMDGTKFAKMLSDKHLFELDRMAYKYSAADVREFSEILRQNFAQPLPLVDFAGQALVCLPNLAQISTKSMKQLLLRWAFPSLAR